MADPPRDGLSSPEACYCGCEGALGSWEGFVRRTPNGAYGTRPAVEANTVQYQTGCRKEQNKEISCRTSSVHKCLLINT